MDAALLLPACPVRPLGTGALSALPEGAPAGHYDGFARLYDRVVGSACYNRLLWGTDPADYRAFAVRAVTDGAGPLLDAGCGSAAFTAAAYAATARPVVLVDRSAGMLAAAGRRIAAAGGPALPRVQADLFDLPFRPRAFGTVLSMGMLHLFDDAEALVGNLRAALAPGGRLFLTALVAATPVGRRYLAALHRAGEVARPRTFAQTRALVARATGVRVEAVRRGSMAYLVAGPV